MSVQKRLPPCAVCTTCGEATRSMELINATHRCSGKRRGVWGTMLNTADWKECESCRAIGLDGGHPCRTCAGVGWLTELRLPPELEDAIDEWRRRQPDLPPRAEAARRLIDCGRISLGGIAP
jgi:hypothetical protein